MNECIEAAPARNQGRLTPALVKETTLPRPGTPPYSADLALARSVSLRLDAATAVDRSTTRGTVQHTPDQVTPGSSRNPRARSFRLGAGSRVPRAALVRPSRQVESETRCHEGGAPLHVSCETTTHVGARASSRMRATRVSCSTPFSAGSPCPLTCGEGSRRRDHDRSPRREPDRASARCYHHTNDAPVGSQRVEGSCEHGKRVQQGEPRLDLSRAPLVTHRMRTASEHDVPKPMGRRPSRSTERHRVVRGVRRPRWRAPRRARTWRRSRCLLSVQMRRRNGDRSLVTSSSASARARDKRGIAVRRTSAFLTSCRGELV